MNTARIVHATTPAQLETVRALFREYAEATGACECFEGFAEELAGLPGSYAPPNGRLLIAEVASTPDGCVALRKLAERVCEMKRLYTRPEFRGRKLGRRLAESAIGEARRTGYHVMRLDTLSSMTAALALYRSLDFQTIPRYNDNPSADAIHLELALT